VVDLTRPCGKCGAVNRYPSGRCKPCKIKAKKIYLQSDEGRAKTNAYNRNYYKSAEALAKIIAYRQTAIGRQRYLASQAKYKKTLFEFSLQNQQKVIEQCQQKQISGKDG
jgi:hypothetical protein